MNWDDYGWWKIVVLYYVNQLCWCGIAWNYMVILQGIVM